jgi:AraC-like DNA-binding protein
MHIAYLTTLIEELESRGINSSDLVDPIPVELSPQQLDVLLHKAIQLCHDPSLGLSFGMRLNVASHGMLGYAIMSSRNGQQLINGLTRFSRLAMPSITLTPVEKAGQFQLVCRATSAVTDLAPHMEIVLATLVAGARSIFNKRIPGAAVWLSYPAPEHSAKYNQLRIPVLFGQAECALVCDRTFLEMELPSANPVLAEIGQRQCYEMLGDMKKRAGIAGIIRAELMKANGEFAAQDAMAKKLAMSGRTLRRQLAVEQTSYRDIVDEIRFELAQRYLETGYLPITEIAVLLDYEDPSNFRRAFKRWSGITAQQWQKNHAVAPKT